MEVTTVLKSSRSLLTSRVIINLAQMSPFIQDTTHYSNLVNGKDLHCYRGEIDINIDSGGGYECVGKEKSSCSRSSSRSSSSSSSTG